MRRMHISIGIGVAQVYLPHPSEWHPGHRAALPMIRTALRDGAIRAGPADLRGLDSAIRVRARSGHYLGNDGQAAAVRCYRSQLKSFRYDPAGAGPKLLSWPPGRPMPLRRGLRVLQRVIVSEGKLASIVMNK
jgi:hypothetical protein